MEKRLPENDMVSVRICTSVGNQARLHGGMSRFDSGERFCWYFCSYQQLLLLEDRMLHEAGIVVFCPHGGPRALSPQTCESGLRLAVSDERFCLAVCQKPRYPQPTREASSHRSDSARYQDRLGADPWDKCAARQAALPLLARLGSPGSEPEECERCLSGPAPQGPGHVLVGKPISCQPGTWRKA
jgi:hypothetical protein